jgi:DNA polymerase-3 subunit gamma/tau
MVRKSDSPPAQAMDLEASWQKITESISHSHPSLAANLKKCYLRWVKPQRVEIVIPENQFTSSILRREKNVSLLKKLCGEVFGVQAELAIVAGAECAASVNELRERHQAVVKATLNHPLIAEAIDIFNGKLLDVQVLKEVDE